MSDPEQGLSKAVVARSPHDLDSVGDTAGRSASPSVPRVVARARAIAKRYTDGHPDASVDAFLARRVEECGE